MSSISTAVVTEGAGVMDGVGVGFILGIGVCEGEGVCVGKGNGLIDGKGKGEKNEIAIGTASNDVNIIVRQFTLI